MFIKSLAAGLLALVASVGVLGGVAHAQSQTRVPHRIQKFDVNHDGVLQASEVPQRLQTWFAAVDANKDGVVTADEIRAYNRAHPHPHHGHHAQPQPSPTAHDI